MRFRASWVAQGAVGLAVTPRMCTVRVATFMAKNTYSRFKITVSTRKKFAASGPEAWARRNSRQAGPELGLRRGGGSRPALRRTRRMVEAPTRCLQAAQLALNPGIAPRGVPAGQAQDEGGEFFGDRRPARAGRFLLPLPAQ